MLPPIRRRSLSPAARTATGRIAMASAALAGLLLAAAALAHPAEEPSTVVVRHVDPRPQTAAAALRLLRRIERAQAEACGASPSSVPPHRVAILHGDCFGEGVARTVAQIGSPLLRAAHAERHTQRGQ